MSKLCYGNKVPEAYKMYAFKHVVPESCVGEQRQKLYEQFKRQVDEKFERLDLVIIYEISRNFQYFFRFSSTLSNRTEILIKRVDGKITLFITDDYKSNKPMQVVDDEKIFS